MKKLVSFILALSMSFSLCCLSSQAASGDLGNFQKINIYSQGQYTDVPAENTFAENVRTAYEYNIMQGYGSTFGISNSITRLASIIIACRIHCIYYNGVNNIESTYSGTTSEMYLQYAEKNNIISSFSDYSKAATREEFAAILCSALPSEALLAINVIDDGAIPDVDAESEYVSKIYSLYRAGVLTGSDSKGTFYPYTNITRGAACAIATRMCNTALRKHITLTTVVEEPSIKPDVSPQSPVALNTPYDVAVKVSQAYNGHQYAYITWKFDGSTAQSLYGAGFEVYQATNYDGPYELADTFHGIVEASDSDYFAFSFDLQNGITYYYKVRFYTTINDTVYSSYSKVLNITTESDPTYVTEYNGAKLYYPASIGNPTQYADIAYSAAKAYLKYPAMAKPSTNFTIISYDDNGRDLNLYGYILACNAFGVYSDCNYCVVFENANPYKYRVIILSN